MDRGAWWATVHGGHKESDTTEHTHTHHTRLTLTHHRHVTCCNNSYYVWTKTQLDSGQKDVFSELKVDMDPNSVLQLVSREN